MTVYRTCHPCAKRNDCEIKRVLSDAIRGFGVKTITHKCSAFEPVLKPGQNVWARVAINRPPDGGYYGYGPVTADYATFPAVFIQLRKALGQAVVYIETDAPSKCGQHRFKPLRGNGCAVSYAPLLAKGWWYSHDGWEESPLTKRCIVGVREGVTPLCQFCRNPQRPGCCDTSNIVRNAQAIAKRDGVAVFEVLEEREGRPA